jgi:hypothetical protein
VRDGGGGVGDRGRWGTRGRKGMHYGCPMLKKYRKE